MLSSTCRSFVSSLYYRDKDARRSPVEESPVLCGRGLWDRPVKARVATARRSKPFLRLLYLVPSSLFLFFACFVLAICCPLAFVFSCFRSLLCLVGDCFYVYFLLPYVLPLCLSLCLSFSLSFSFSCFMSFFISLFPFFCVSFVHSFFLSRFPLSSFFFAFFLSLFPHSFFMSCFLPSFFLAFFLSFCLGFFLSFSFMRSFFLSFFLSFCLLLLLSFCRSAVSVFLAFCQSLGIPT